MICFEARNQFEAFWRREMPLEGRAALAAHLRECAKCDRSFRLFALTAPVLYSATEPETRGGALRSGLHTVAMPTSRGAIAGRRSTQPVTRWRGASVAVAMAAAAVLAIYVATAPGEMFEDSIAGDSNPEVETSSNVQPVSIFGEEVSGQDSGVQDPLMQESPVSLQNELAG